MRRLENRQPKPLGDRSDDRGPRPRIESMQRVILDEAELAKPSASFGVRIHPGSKTVDTPSALARENERRIQSCRPDPIKGG